jgi:hypothetical protein
MNGSGICPLMVHQVKGDEKSKVYNYYPCRKAACELWVTKQRDDTFVSGCAFTVIARG